MKTKLVIAVSLLGLSSFVNAAGPAIISKTNKGAVTTYEVDCKTLIGTVTINVRNADGKATTIINPGHTYDSLKDAISGLCV